MLNTTIRRKSKMMTLLDYGAHGNGEHDDTPAFEKYIESLYGGLGTVVVPDGVYAISKKIRLPQGISLQLGPGAVIKALPDYWDDVLVETESFDHEDARWEPQSISGGVLDGSGLPLTGVRTVLDRETDIRHTTIRNCCFKGIHIGVEGCCETNLANVRVQCERGVYARAGSIGIHYEKTTDNLVCGGIVIGYETGLRSDSSSNDFQQVHVWNYQENCRLATCFHCNGWNDSYCQCYADSPMNGDDPGYGFFVEKPFQRFSNCRIYNNQWVTPDRVIGFWIEAGGTHGSYIGNHFTARDGHEMKAAFAGNILGGTFLGNTYARTVLDGKLNRIQSHVPGDAINQPLVVTGDRVALEQPLAAVPDDAAGEIGQLAWVESDAGSYLVVKTAGGWKRARLE